MMLVLTFNRFILFLLDGKFNWNAKQVMIDPDVPGPSDPYLKEHLHWYVHFSFHFGTISHICTFKLLINNNQS